MIELEFTDLFHKRGKTHLQVSKDLVWLKSKFMPRHHKYTLILSYSSLARVCRCNDNFDIIYLEGVRKRGCLLK